MSKSLLVKFWQRVSSDLSIEIETPHIVSLPDGATLQFDVLVKNFSQPMGVIMDENGHKWNLHRELVLNLGYGYSSFGPLAPNSIYDIDSITRMLSEWGWTGDPTKKPNWLVDPESNEE